MKILIKLLPFILGGALVIQSSLNKSIAQSKGLSTALVINGLIVVFCSLIIFILSYFFPHHFSEIITYNNNNLIFKWWYIIPGFLGFCALLILPIGIMKIGALPIFLGVIAGQIIVSIIYDFYFENISINLIRVSGALLTFIGAFLVVWKR